ncbi:TPA: PD-(D/E)XK nuclease-like domain-containing protein [Citrobacter freundii]|uniref:RecE family exodeoxyribonuclease n=1 Tax=Citrobacter freundii TaxID=546 RepID=UPI001A2ECDF3|nr:RecE family exodeoxyribonuclease [Citrobacter freundii]WQC28516.1 RecE family exodeoxyribonuclease [Citrobacter freundii]HAT4016701.1 exodeoxyribonuclease VIII [Citrobacter freundii]HAT4019122.1 exodeoxyribonuclease VIII [Citrobacter freundii]HAT4024198.1 exodeoxyribonuclease VIII [Citrobacter freundii]HAT4035035.1 exodeoxyribonuclease VIII [Citrobacter freundii]
MEFFNVVKATQKSGKQDAVVWFTAKTEARANLMLDVALEDAGIETGRGKDYAKPIRTDFPVVDDLPEEGEIDFTWCDRYELAEDQRTWNVKLKADNAAQEENHQAADNIVDGETGHADESQQAEQPQLITVATLSLRQRILAQFISDEYAYHIDAEQKKIIQGLELDVDNSYVQNLLLAAENVEFFKNAAEIDISRVVAALKTVFPVEGKRTELSLVMRFIRIWFNTEHIDRGLLVKEWQKGNRVAQIQRTDVKTNAGGGNKTDRNTDYVHTLDTLDVEIALATLPMDFNIYDIPGGVYRRAKEIVSKKESPFSEWSEALRKTAGILDYSRAAIFALIRGTSSELVNFPGRLRAYINANLTENDHSNPSEETLADAGHAPDVSWENEVNEQVAAEQKTAAKQPQIANMGNGVFSIDGLMGDQQTQTDDRSPLNEETTSNVQLEETVSDEEQAGDEVKPCESSLETGEESYTGQQADVSQNTDSVAQNSDSVNQTDPLATQTEPETQSDEPAVVYPAYFEPGRYEGLPNEVYHAANGISSTQVKDARVSLMFYHGRHVTKTIRRESSEALTFGSLAHTLALEPEKLHEEFAVFPGIPAEAFTTTDSMKAFIREFNADKPKAEQLKLTGKKEELQAAIRAISPEAIFADEFEQQWRDSVDGKTILSREKLTLATAIQQALLNHESAGKLLRHPSRSVETSYFGMDDETGLEVRVRPDLEVEINGVRIGVDLKTISMGRVKQDGLRAKLHREIIDRDYHLSAGMYCSVADFDQFYWIFVNKDEGYHWVAVIEASEDLLDLGLLEYQRTMRALANAYDTDCWSAPITEEYTDELNDFDLRRLEALRLA